jgi:hypothetical protein
MRGGSASVGTGIDAFIGAFVGALGTSMAKTKVFEIHIDPINSIFNTKN